MLTKIEPQLRKEMEGNNVKVHSMRYVKRVILFDEQVEFNAGESLAEKIGSPFARKYNFDERRLEGDTRNSFHARWLTRSRQIMRFVSNDAGV